jgi:nitroimidazol reductase NimA-like FMN-containing flavoprotein (pyridoxamine 5'-phosphate oxidase superfamily)
VLETPAEIDRLQELLDRSAAGAGAHLRGIVSDERRLDAVRVCERLQGMRLLVVATVTADGRPLAGPVDGYFLHGSFYFSSGRDSVRMRHLAARPAVSATYLEGEELAVTVHGRAELFDVSDPAHAELRQAMLDHYLPRQGPAFETWLDQIDAVGARIDAAKMFTYSTSDLAWLVAMIEDSTAVSRAWSLSATSSSHAIFFTCPSCSERRSG